MSGFISKQAEDGLAGQVESYLFGCELTSKTTYYTFKVDEEDEYDHSLSLCTISLGEGAKDEYNVVEVTARNHTDEDTTVPIATLKLSCQTMVNVDNFEIRPPVTFRLKFGSGPVLLSGQVIVAPPDLDSEEEEEDEEEEDDDDLEEEEDDEDLVPIKPVNKKMRK
ncbi:nucleoplasmin-3 [Pseudophryne corroboree]|uniref:nucleoplasmin-3 n=1 Tax=Pseudophryne corroboree TaxID=495146 RepID=UPI003081FEDC